MLFRDGGEGRLVPIERVFNSILIVVIEQMGFTIFKAKQRLAFERQLFEQDSWTGRFAPVIGDEAETIFTGRAFHR